MDSSVVFMQMFNNYKLFLGCLPVFLLIFLVQPARASKERVADELMQEPATGSFLIGIEEAKALVAGSKRTVFVDIRPQRQFNRAHIPGSLNIALHFIKSKTFLKTMHLILVNQGFARASLVEGVSLLRECGFQVHILSGGLTSWKQHGEKVAGEKKVGGEIYMVSAEAVAYESEPQAQPFLLQPGKIHKLPCCFPAQRISRSLWQRMLRLLSQQFKGTGRYPIEYWLSIKRAGMRK